MESVRYSESCDVTDTPVEHITASGHHETNVITSLENLCGSLDEILRSLLIGDASKEGNDLLLHVPLDLEFLTTAEVNGIMYRNNLIRIDT